MKLVSREDTSRHRLQTYQTHLKSIF